MIWPDGRSQWMSDTKAMLGYADVWRAPCWSRHFIDIVDDGYYGKNETQKDAIQAMRRYDKSNGWPAAWYLGEI